MTSAPALALLTVSTVRVASPGALLDLLPADGALAWVSGGEGLVGWGTAAECRTSGPERFAEARSWWTDLTRTSVVRDEAELPGSGEHRGPGAHADLASSVTRTTPPAPRAGKHRPTRSVMSSDMSR